MADVKISALTAYTAPPALSDLLPGVSDPAGTPVTKKMTVQQLQGAVGGVFQISGTDPNGNVTALRPAICYSISDGSLWVKTNATLDSASWEKLLG